eukprot:TRINITY_DN390_c0_g1_i1.p1 TRINITY_DN390_c0_g1~~TRINITY_DN390_c0_g1_i1.p1  ORF type:complete len:301 (+),score=136.83 TRINITY_DN390_c0_g1_i1:136-1038(+)
MPGLKLGKEAQAKFTEARTNPDKAGYLDKKGAKRKNWNSRWFVLKDNYLFYCKNESSNPQGIINLYGCTVSHFQGPTARAHSFSLLAPKSVSIDAKWTNRTYFMAAKDAKEMDLWMEKLEDSGRKAVERAAAKRADGGAATPTPTPTPAKETPKAVEEKREPRKSDDEFSSSDEEPPKKVEPKKEEVKKEEPKKEEPKKEEVKKEEPKVESPRKTEELARSTSEDADKKEKRRKKEKKVRSEDDKERRRQKKEKREKRRAEREKKEKEEAAKKKEASSSDESEEEKPKKKDASDSEEDSD